MNQRLLNPGRVVYLVFAFVVVFGLIAVIALIGNGEGSEVKGLVPSEVPTPPAAMQQDLPTAVPTQPAAEERYIPLPEPVATPDLISNEAAHAGSVQRPLKVAPATTPTPGG